MTTASATKRSSSGKSKSNHFASAQRFADVAGLHPATLRALSEGFRYERLSAAQAAYLAPAMAGGDLLVRAGTGSGKTLGFLIPVVQRVLAAKADAAAASGAASGGGPFALVVSPSRELADQTRREAERLVAFHRSPAIAVQMVTGGNSVGAERRRLLGQPCDLLVATPGRLEDHLENAEGFAARLAAPGQVRALVLDEADRLLDMGFAPAMRRIAAALGPASARQTLLYTATVPDSVRGVAAAFMRPGFAYVDASAAGGPAGNGAAAASSVRVEAVVLPVPSLVPALHRVLLHVRATDAAGHKVIVFVSTAAMAAFLAELLRAAGLPDTLELHSRLSQPHRNATTRRFAESRGLVLVASDVVARGIDFPDVTLVVQLGAASDDAQVVHRAGRTGRGGKSGNALLILGDDERPALDALLSTAAGSHGGVPVPGGVTELRPASVSAVVPPEVLLGPAVTPLAALAAVYARVARDDDPLRRAACKAFEATLGFYKAQVKRLKWRTPEQFVRNVMLRFASLSAPTCPVEKRKLRKMGIPEVDARAAGLAMVGGGGGGGGGAGR